MVRVLYDGAIYGKQVRGGVGRIFEEYISRFADDSTYGIDPLLLLPEKIQRLPDALTERGAFKHIRPADGLLSRIPGPLRQHATKHFQPPLRWLTRARIRRKQPRIFHSTYYTSPPLTGLKTVVTVYDLIDENTFLSMSGNPAGFVRQVHKHIEAADVVVAISNATRNDILEFTKAKEEDVHTIHLGASGAFSGDRLATKEETARIKREYGIEGPYWFYVGRRNPYKNFNALLRAWKIFRDNTGIDSWLMITGAYGDLQKWEIDFLMQHHLENRVVMTRTVEDDRLRILYRGAAAFVFPSLYEGFGIPILEAFACQAPCILADTPVFREVADDAALYFEPYNDEGLADLMAKILDEDCRAGLIARGEERLKLFSWDKSARQMAEVYEGML